MPTGNTQQVINYGASANDGQGDPLRTAFIKTDENFDNIWLAGPAGSNVRITDNTISVIDTNGNLILSPNGVGVIQTNNTLVPRANRSYDLGSTDLQYRAVYANTATFQTLSLPGDLTVGGNLTVQGNIIQVGNIVTETLTIQLANAATTGNAANGSGITVGASDNIATLLYNATSNTWTTNIGANISGNVTAPYFIGNGSQLTGLAPTYGNANVSNFLANYGSNTIVTTGNVSAGNVLTSAGVIASGVIQSGTGLSTGGYLSVNGSTDLHDTTITGNLSVSVIKNDDSTVVKIEDGVEIDGDALVNGDVTADAFIGNGNLTLQPDPANPSSYLDIFLTSGPDLHLAASNGANLILGEDAGPNVMTSWDGNVYVQSWNQDTGTQGGVWNFAGDGTTIFPTLTVDLHNGGNQSAQTLQFGDPNQQAIITGPTPAVDTNAQRLIIQGQAGNGTGEGGDVYLWAGDAQNNGGDIKIYAGDADAGNVGDLGGYVNIDGGAGYTRGGQVEITGGYSASGDGGYVNLIGGYGNTGGNVGIQAGYGQGGPGGNVSITGGASNNGLAEYGNVNINAGASAWTFDNTGNLTVPGNILGSGNILIAPDSASPSAYLDIYLTGGPDIHIASNDNSIVIGRDTGANIFVGNDGEVSIQSNTGNAQVWTFGADGLTYLPDGTHFGAIEGANTFGFYNSNANTDFLLEAGLSTTWSFNGTTGNLTTPGGMAINGNISLFGTDTALIQPTNNQPLAIVSSGANGSISSVWVDNISDPGNSNVAGMYVAYQGNANIRLVSGNNASTVNIWDFGPDGALTLPGEGILQSINDQVTLQSFNTTTGNANSVYLGTSGGLGFNDQEIGGNWLEIFRNGAEPEIRVPVGRGNLNLQTASGNTAYNWVFDDTGNLTLPANTFAVNYANGTAVSLGGAGNYGNANVATFLAAFGSNTISTTGNVTASNFVGNGIGLTNVTVSVAGNIVGTQPNVSLVAGSYTYTFDNTGILTLPAPPTGNEGGEIDFGKAGNSSLSGNTVVLDQYVDRFRFFETGGTNRGAYIDLTQAAAGVGTLLNNRVSGLVNAGTYVTMDLIKATVTTSGNRGLSLASVSGSFNVNISGNFNSVGAGNGGDVVVTTITTTPSSSIFGWGFNNQGDTATFVLTDTTNSRAYRITMQIGNAFNNNAIIIERLI